MTDNTEKINLSDFSDYPKGSNLPPKHQRQQTFRFQCQILILEMVITHYRKILSSLYTKNLCHAPPLPFQTEKDASHILMTHAILHNLLFYSSVSNSNLCIISLTIDRYFIYWFFNNSYLITWIINSNGLSSMGFTISGFPIF